VVQWDDAYVIEVALACAADLTGGSGGAPDGQVNVLDLLELLSLWGSCPTQSVCSGDLPDSSNGLDCQVGVQDLLAMLGAWGPCSNPTGFIPEDEQDCIDEYGLEQENRAKLEACLEAVAAKQQQGE